MKWTNSALTTLQGCGERFRRRYLERDWRPSGPRGIRGTAVHRVARTGMLRKMTAKVLPSVEEARDLAADSFEAEWDRGVTLTADEQTLGVDKVKAESKDFAVDLSGFHVERVAPAINPVGVERRITVKPQDSALVIEGTIDLIDATPTGEVIRDLKTTEKSPPKDAAHRSQQLTMYGMIRLAEVGTMASTFALDHLVRTPERHEQKHVLQETTRTPEDVSALVSRLNMAVQAVEAGIFVPAGEDAWFCHPNYCEYWNSCPYTAKGRRRMTT